MKRGIIFFGVMFIVVFSFFVYAENNTITGNAVSGEAITQNININVTVTSVGTALMTINSPKNQTYFSNTSILLNFSGVNIQASWFNLDNKNNITITSPYYFNLTQFVISEESSDHSKNHTLYLFANNSVGTVTKKNVTFSMNSSLFMMLDYSRYMNQGNTTNFNLYSSEQLQNLSDVTFENVSSGKIFFLSGINISNTGNLNNLNSYINITFNRIEINTSALPNFNTSAKLSIYNLMLTNPRIAMEGFVCPSSVCVKESYSGGVLIFNVTHFTAFSAEETPASSSDSGSSGSSAGGGSGGSGGGSTSYAINSQSSFDVIPDRLSISLKQGETKQSTITIINQGTKELTLNIENKKLDDFIKIDTPTLNLKPSESKAIQFDFLARETQNPDVYIGKLIVKDSNGIEKEVLIALSVESKKPLFDLNVEIPPQFLSIKPGEGVVANVKLFNLGQTNRVDALIEYILEDSSGKEILKEKETLAVETQTSFTKIINIPSNIPEGNYLIVVKANYGDTTADASTWFVVKNENFVLTNNQVLLNITIIIIMGIVIVNELRKNREYLKKYGKINEHLLAKKGYIKKYA